MSANFKDATVYGEKVGDLGPAFKLMAEGGRFDDVGGFHLDVRLPPDAAAPMVRAVYRAEAELLLEDAERLDAISPLDRTDEQRRADAWMCVVRGIGMALGAVPSPSRAGRRDV